MTRFERLAGEIKTIGSIELAIKAKSILEKFLWITFFIVGIGWLAYFMKGTFEDVNPTTSMRLTKKIEELNYPAITICSDVTTKYAIAEQFGNYLDPAELPKEFEDHYSEKLFRHIQEWEIAAQMVGITSPKNVPTSKFLSIML